jgi:hypothetical protein
VNPGPPTDAFYYLARQHSDGRALPPPKPVGIVKLLVGVVLPFVCLALSYPMRPDWQSGATRDYAQLMLSHAGLLPLYPFLLYSMTSLVLLFARPARFRGNPWVRFGIFSGTLLATEYWLLFQFAFDAGEFWTLSFCSLLSGFLPLVIWRFASLYLPRKFFPWIIVGAILVLLVVMVAFSVPILLVGCLWCSTPWALACYLHTSVHLIYGNKDRLRFGLSQLFGLSTWFAGHCGAWRLSYLLMLEEYSRLPKNPPNNCFICTAVTNGHPRIVHGEGYHASDGTICRVNDQLRVLKAFELLLLGVSPKSHFACRWIYNRFGPRFAAMIVHPLLADAGYFLLKPVEWLAVVCLGFALRGKTDLIYRLYPSACNDVSGQ